MSVVYHNISQLLSLEGAKNKDGRKIISEDLGIINNAYLVEEDGFIKEVGSASSTKQLPDCDKAVDINSGVVLPCFVDSHTHICFGGNRSSEFEMRSEGKTYQEIANAGGGIISTVNQTRKASLEELTMITVHNAKRIMSFGTGVIEAKSGYGLDFENEIKQLRAIREAKKIFPNIIPSFLGAHDIPPGDGNKETRKKKYIELLISEIIPKVAELKLAKFCDAFLEEGYYTREETSEILKTASKFGMISKLHTDEFTNQEGAVLATELGAVSADHLVYISEKGIEALANSDTVACLHPGTSFSLRLPFAPAKKIIDAGACIAIASDFNPGSNPGLNMQLFMSLAVSQMKISIAQAIAAATYGGAKALCLEKEFGVLLPGYRAQFSVFDIKSYTDIFYNYGENYFREIVQGV